MTPLMELLPRELNYEESPEMAAIQNALTAAAEDVWAARDGFTAQLSPETATWGLPAWEEALALSPRDRSDIAARRRAVIAKLRGVGVSTVERILSVAKAELGDGTWLIEYPGEYRIEIHVRGAAAEVADFSALTRALKEIMPAHLRFTYGLEYPRMTTTAYYAGAAGAYSRTVLPEWRMDQSFTGTVNIAGAYSVRSRTGLPPAE